MSCRDHRNNLNKAKPGFLFFQARQALVYVAKYSSEQLVWLDEK
jgi:hypothetical protein